MSELDWVIVGFTALLAVYGYLQGFVVGALSLLGFALGALVGTRLAPLVLHDGARSPDAPVLGLVGALLVGVVFANGLEGVGARLRRAMRLPGLRRVDGLLGAMLTACVGLGIAWIVGAVALDASDSAPLRADIRASQILRTLDRMLPPSGPVLDALARIDPLPSVRGPGAPVAAPDAAILARPGVRDARRSVVRVFGMACGLGIEGSGWVAAPGTIVTNAHVVAGEHETAIQPGGAGPGLAARVVGFDTRNDVAILRVAGLDLPVLRMAASAPAGTAGALLGYPRDGPFDARPARIGATETVRTEDAYGDGDVSRAITPLRGLVRPGNSGGPIVDRAGRVLATAFASITGASRPGGFAIPNRLVTAELRAAGGRTVATGHCTE